MIVALALGAGGWLIGQQLDSSPRAPRASKRTPSTPSQPRTPSGLTPFQDPGGAFAGSYPSSWQRLQSADAAVVLLAASSDGGSVLVRKTQIGTQVNASNLGAARKLTDRVVRSGKNVVFLHQPQQVMLGGLAGYLYLYTFDDPNTGQPGAHAHYFLFRGTTMITLVFQALPAARITSFARLFDSIASTFRALPA